LKKQSPRFLALLDASWCEGSVKVLLSVGNDLIEMLDLNALIPAKLQRMFLEVVKKASVEVRLPMSDEDQIILIAECLLRFLLCYHLNKIEIGL